MGRPNADYPAEWDQVIGEWRAGGITATAAMKRLNLRRTTFYMLAQIS
jgi:hypothetical protein